MEFFHKTNVKHDRRKALPRFMQRDAPLSTSPMPHCSWRTDCFCPSIDEFKWTLTQIMWLHWFPKNGTTFLFAPVKEEAKNLKSQRRHIPLGIFLYNKISLGSCQ